MAEPTPEATLRPIDEGAFGHAQARHLLWRAGFGGTPSQVRTLEGWGPSRSVDHLLNFKDVQGYPEPKAEDFDGTIMREPTEEERRAYRLAARNQDEDVLAKIRLERQRREQSDRGQIRNMQRWWLKRMIETPRPLEEKLTLFWHGHFATGYRTIENSYHMFMQNQMFRDNAAGNFGDLLRGIVRDPAMIKYLDNDESRKQQPNENLAREIMELFSLGEGSYSEKDIKEGARALTGYSFEGNAFKFREERHDKGAKTILGKTGALDGDGFVSAILSRRTCAQFIALKMYRYFVNDAMGVDEKGRRPETRATVEVVDELADTLIASKYDLKPMLRKLFLSKHFYDASNMGAQIKSPAQLVVGAVRSLGTPVRDMGILNDALDLMGQSLFYPPNVAGWKGGRSWINTSTLFVRQNIMAFLLTGRLPQGVDPSSESQPYDPMPLLAPLALEGSEAVKDPARVAGYLIRTLLPTIAGESYEEELRGYAKSRGNEVTPEVVTGMLALITAAPEYQLC